MSRNDNNVDDFVVMVIHQPLNHLSFARPGDRAWTPVLTRGATPNKVHQVMYWKGLVLILYKDRTFAYFDINSTLIGSATPVEAKNYYSLVPVRFVGISQAGLGDGTLYTMELNGDLLAVVRHREQASRYVDEDGVHHDRLLDCGNWYRTNFFVVYKYVKSWERVKDLGEYVLFVGYNYASVVHISKAPNCQRNAIYFVDDEYYYYCIQGCQEARGHDMGMFDMTSGLITPFYKGGDTISKCFAPIWFSPNF